MSRARANRIKELRNRGVPLTLKETGALMGLDLTTVSHHENGTRELTEEQVEAYSKLFKVPSHQLFMAPLEEKQSTQIAS